MLRIANNGGRFSGNILTLPLGFLGQLELKRPVYAPLIEGVDWALRDRGDGWQEVCAVPESLPDWDFPVLLEYREEGAPDWESVKIPQRVPFDLPRINIAEFRVWPSPGAIPTYKHEADYTVDYRKGFARRTPNSRIPASGDVSYGLTFGCHTLDAHHEVFAFDDRGTHALEAGIVFDDRVGDYLHGRDYTIDRSGGVVIREGDDRLGEGETLEIEYSVATPSCYAMPQDYLDSFEQPDAANKNWVAVARALEAATETAKRYFWQAQTTPPTLPLAPEYEWVRGACLRLAHIELRHCHPEHVRDELAAALRPFEQLKNFPIAPEETASDSRVAAVGSQSRFANAEGIYGD